MVRLPEESENGQAANPQRSFAVCALFGKAQGQDKIGPNGLPLPPSSIKILGRFQALQSLTHPHLCSYVDLLRGNSGCVLIISEHYNTTLTDCVEQLTSAQRLTVCHQLVQSVAYLHAQNIVVGRLNSQHILIEKRQPISIKLTNHGLLYATEYGAHVDFSIPDVYTSAPELLVCVTRRGNVNALCSQATDVWALGIVLLEICMGITLRQIWNEKQLVGVLVTMLQRDVNGSALEGLLSAIRLQRSNVSMPDNWSILQTMVQRCLVLLPSKRPSTAEICAELDRITGKTNEGAVNPLEMSALDALEYYRQNREWLTQPLSQLPVTQLYVLWRLCGSDPETYLHKAGLLKRTAPVTTLPGVVIGECDVFGNEAARTFGVHLALFPLKANHLYKQMSKLPPTAFIMLLERRYQAKKEGDAITEEEESEQLPLSVKERSADYQLRRMILFDRLIAACPFKLDWLKIEAIKDVPPIFRAQVWSLLLSVVPEVAKETYELLDTVTPTVSDRQLEVDIPRCHQYDELLCSPVAHAKFMRVLKAWILTNPQYVYWQGLDSLTAPFLYLNFNDEHLALACLTSFINRYLHGLFRKDNSAVIKEYLAVFNHVITYHEPKLSRHLKSIEFTPDLYAIQWFLTAFAHVMPLYKVMHLWDNLLLRSAGFPLCVGIAILKQQRTRLLEYGFNECILHFSDLPGVDMERCIVDACAMYSRTPASILHRIHMAKYELTTSSGHDQLDCVPTDIPLDVPDITLAELIELPCCRLSLRDYLVLYINNDNDQDKYNHILTIDVRPIELYHRYCVPGSVNMPLALDESDDVTSAVFLQSPTAAQLLERVKHQAIMVIVAGQGVTKKHVHQFAHVLIEEGHSRVCLLTATVDSIKRCLTFIA